MNFLKPVGMFITRISFFMLLLSCRSPQFNQLISVNITADGETRKVQVQSGSTVSQALEQAGIIAGKLDRSDPPYYALLSDGDAVQLVRVEEIFETEEKIVPFEKQSVRNETLPEGETRLIQPGVNGLQEITYRKVIEDGIEISRSPVKTVSLMDALPEIVMVGAQSSFTPLSIPGRLVFLSSGNAWIMEGSTANRRLIVSTGDLDGRIFLLSPNSEYLIYTRKSNKPADQEINTLWTVRTTSSNASPVWLQAYNVVHFAGWIPGTNSIAYSTVEPRSSTPGWQANNDLFRVSLAGGNPRKVLESNSGGIYGWWGAGFTFSADGRLAYARPDQIGLVDMDGSYLKPMLDITPLNTHSDWAWTPQLSWSPDGRALYVVTHAGAPEPISPEESPFFNLTGLSFASDTTEILSENTGMFSNPAVSPSRQQGSENTFQVAYLQAIFPEQSDTSRYRLIVMDRDGSDRRTIFPPPDAGGLEPQLPVWSPEPLAGQTGDFIAIIYAGNLWLVDSGNNAAYQVTGDGLISGTDWK
ncbi:MAG: hypothetical protein A2Y54_10515 [Chloroflexi bacterium RBG_16_51_16]|nr:MAG: hypothetical protein A2Y54_10515 [Chloroflexi bacterium RBG_16_51_16]